MSIIALYVTSPMTFTTDTTIESITGESIAPGVVTLELGVYRLPGDAQLTAQSIPKDEETYFQTLLTDPKGGPPDPPFAVLQAYTMAKITDFLGGASEQNAI